MSKPAQKCFGRWRRPKNFLRHTLCVHTPLAPKPVPTYATIYKKIRYTKSNNCNYSRWFFDIQIHANLTILEHTFDWIHNSWRIGLIHFVAYLIDMEIGNWNANFQLEIQLKMKNYAIVANLHEKRNEKWTKIGLILRQNRRKTDKIIDSIISIIWQNNRTSISRKCSK